jgi:hypothetical protein
MGGLSFPQPVNPNPAPNNIQPPLGSRSLLSGSDPTFPMQSRFPNSGGSTPFGSSNVSSVGGIGAIGINNLRNDEEQNEDFPALPSTKHDMGMLGSAALHGSASDGSGNITPNNPFFSPSASGLASVPRPSTAESLSTTTSTILGGNAGNKDVKYGLAGMMENNRHPDKVFYCYINKLYIHL